MSKRFDLDVGKRRVRRRWREFLKPRIGNRKIAQVLCFPGEFGWEIEQCYRPLGFRDENIWGVERDPRAARIIRERYPKINLVESDILDFVKDYNGPPFQVISLDYCGNFGTDKVQPLALLTLRGLIADRACTMVNIMAGREQTEEKLGMRNLYARVLQDKLNLRGKTVTVHEAVELMHQVGEEKLSEVRDNAVTQSILSTLGYLMPSVRVCFDLDLTYVSGTAVALTPTTKILEDDGNGRMVLENVSTDKSDSFCKGTQIKHEAILAINEQLRDLGIIKYAKADSRLRRILYNKGIPDDFFDYHLGRTLVMGFFDKFGVPDFPVTLERYSYVSESGRRMLSDFVETRHFSDTLEQMDVMIAPWTHKDDPTRHCFRLHPEPAFTTTQEKSAYLERLKKFVFHYAFEIAKHIKTEPEFWPEREDLGGGDAIAVDADKLKAKVVELIKKGRSAEEIAQKVPYFQPGTIRAIRAHHTMGTYGKKQASS
jgi:hypothetical protein